MLSKLMVMVSMEVFSYSTLFSDFISLGGANLYCLQSIEATLYPMSFSVCLTEMCVYISFYMQTFQVPLRYQHGKILHRGNEVELFKQPKTSPSLG